MHIEYKTRGQIEYQKIKKTCFKIKILFQLQIPFHKCGVPAQLAANRLIKFSFAKPLST